MRVPRLPKVQMTRRTLVAGGAALVVAGAGVAFGVSRCTRGAADVPAEPTAGSEATGSASAGKLGGKLAVYSSCPAEAVNAVVARFSQDTGVAVSVVRGTEAELAERVSSEAELGGPAADVLWGGGSEWYGSGVEKPVEVGREVAAFAVASGLKVVPTSYADLLSSALAGRVVLCDPTACEAGWLHLVGMLAAAGDASSGAALGSDVSWQFVSDLLAAGAAVCPSEDDALQMVLDGTADVALLSEQLARQQARRTGELDVVWPERGIATATSCAAELSGCRNASQAEAFLDFLAGYDGQQVLADALARPVADDVSVSGGEGVPDDDRLETDGVDAPTDAGGRASLLATWAAVAAGTWTPAGSGEAAAEDAGTGL